LAKVPDLQDSGRHVAAVCGLAAGGVFLLRAGLLFLAKRRRARAAGHPFQHPGRAGAALVLTLIVLGSLSAMALHLADLGLSLRRNGRRNLLQEDLKAAAWIGILQGARQLADEDDLTSDTAGEPWMQNEWTHPSGLHLTIRILDAQGRMDLNTLAAIRTASPSTAAEVVETLLRNSGIARTEIWMARLRTAATGETVSPDSGRMERVGRPFAGWDQIRGTVGPDRFDTDRLDASDAQALFDGLTVLPSLHGYPNRVNLNTAPESVLRALIGPGGETTVRALITRREAGPLRADNGFAPGLDLKRLHRIRDLIDIRSDFFHILCTAEQGRERVRLSALFLREADGTCRPIRWGQCP
jgi:type II secretory pathway component PulK